MYHVCESVHELLVYEAACACAVCVGVYLLCVHVHRA